MNRLGEITLADIGRGIVRYRPFLAVVVAIVLVAAFLPGKVTTNGANVAAGIGNEPGGASQPGATSSAAPGTTGTITPGGAVAPGGVPGAAPGSVGGASNTSTGGVNGYVPPPAGIVTSNQAARDPNCDAGTGRIRLPSVYAPPCVPLFTGNNDGNTYPGVTSKTITVVAYMAQIDPATQAILNAEGDHDSVDQMAANYTAFAALLEHHFQTYGRHIVVKVLKASGSATDETAGRADAVTAAKTDHAFMVWNNGTPVDAFTNELTRDHVLCMCTVTLPASYYLQHAPYVWGTGLPDEDQAYLMRSEVIAKSIAFRKAQYAGDLTLQQKTRSFGLIWYNTPQNAYGAGEKFFVQQLGKRGIKLVDQASYTFDPGSAQNTSDTIMSRFQSEGITSVIFVGDPFYPAFYTSAATRRGYHPEWIVTGSALTDQNTFARVYDQTQWQHAFGLGLLAAYTKNKNDLEVYRMYSWLSNGGQPPGPGTAPSQYALILSSFIGIQLAGPNLNPSTFQRGMFSYPESPSRPGVTVTRAGWGTKLWGYSDYNFSDDGTLLYWDPQASGPDEYGNSGVGLYRRLFGGQRFLAGQFPTNVPWFNANGTITVLGSTPRNDQAPSYQNKCAYMC